MKKLKLLKLSILILFMLGCSNPSQRAIRALDKGDYCKFCQISKESVLKDSYSYNNLGVCYENGFCNYPIDKLSAINNYIMAARWGVEKATENLTRLGVEAPNPDLLIAKQQQENQERQEFRNTALGLLAIGAIAVAAVGEAANTKANQNLYVSNNDDDQGCCSWHSGILRDFLNKPQCDLQGRVMCKDYQSSPTCKCY